MNTLPLTPDALQAIRTNHRLWLSGDTTGIRADLRDADLCDANLRGANLHGANLVDADLRGANLRDANLHGANLRDANLAGADLRGANLHGANLVDANLVDADLRGARGLPPVPTIPCLDSAILAQVETATNALDMATWHACATTHCRAGWAITLAGAAGADLENRYGPGMAGALLYAAAYPVRPIPDFYASTADALAELRASAAQEAQGDQTP